VLVGVEATAAFKDKPKVVCELKLEFEALQYRAYPTRCVAIYEMTYSEAVLRHNDEMFLRGLDNALRYLGGVSLRLSTSKEDGLRRWTNSTK
jgi:hypothetical protein